MKKLLLLFLSLMIIAVLSGCARFMPQDEVAEPVLPDESLLEEPDRPPLEPEEPAEEPEQEDPQEPPNEAAGQTEIVFGGEPVFLGVLADNTQEELTPDDERVLAVKSVLKEAFRHTNNMQTVSADEMRAIWSETYSQYLFTKHQEPFEEFFVRNAKERNWLAKTENKVMEFIIFAPENFATTRLHWTVTYTSGNFDGLDFNYELNKPYQKSVDIRLIYKEGEWKINDWIPIAAQN